MNSMGQKLKKLRQEKGLTLRKVGERLGQTQVYFSHIENGRRNPKIATISKILKIGFKMTEKEATPLLREWELERLNQKARIWGGKLNKTIGVTVDLYEIVDNKLEKIGVIPYEKDLIKKGQYYALSSRYITMPGNVHPEDRLLIEKTYKIVDKKPMLFRLNEKYGLGYLYQMGKYIEIKHSHKEWPSISLKDKSFEILGVVRAITNLNP